MKDVKSKNPNNIEYMESVGEFIDFDGVDGDLYIEEKRKAAKARHSKTGITKNEIIKPMFLAKKIQKLKNLNAQKNRLF